MKIRKERKHRQKRIFLQGYYGNNNLGDDYILCSILNTLNKIGDCKVCVKSEVEYDYFNNRFNNIDIYYLAGKSKFYCFKLMLSSDYYIIGGGGLFPEERNSIALITLIRVLCARIAKTKVGFYGVEFNSFNKRISRFFWQKIFNLSDVVIVRNKENAEMIHRMGVSKAYSGVDVTFSFDNDVEQTEKTKEKIIIWALAAPWNRTVINGNMELEQRYEKLKSQLISVINDIKDYKHVFVPFFYKNDIEMIRDIEKWLTIDYQVIDDINNMLFDKKRQVFKSAKFAVCMRFHSVVFSLYSGIPFCAISYSPKTTNILSEYGLENSFVEYGITSSQFFYREFDLDFDKFKHLIDEQLSSTELARLGYLKKELRKKGKQQENLLVKWIGGRI